MTVKEYAEKHGLTPAKVRELCRSGKITATKVKPPAGGKLRYEITEEQPTEDPRTTEAEDKELQENADPFPLDPEETETYGKKSSIPTALILMGAMLIFNLIKQGLKATEDYENYYH